MPTYVTNEVPTGTVNGVNTSFDTVQDIKQIMDITIDGVPYNTGYSFSGNTVTLTDAPTLDIHVSYLSA